MVKIKYVGDNSSVSVKVYNATYKGWKRNEIRDIGEYEAEKLITDNKNFMVEKDAKKVKTIKKDIVFEEDDKMKENKSYTEESD